MLGTDCSKKLKKQIDCAFTPADDRDETRFVFIRQNEKGCVFMRPDGLCRLHAELGERVLPSVCRQYPRAIRTRFRAECACSTSCERVVELLFMQKDGLKIQSLELPSDAKVYIPQNSVSVQEYEKRADRCAEIMGDGTLTIDGRLEKLGKYICTLDQRHNFCGIPFSQSDDAMKLTRFFGGRSESLADYSSEVLKTIENPDCTNLLAGARTSFYEKYPDWPQKCENLLLNHMFYEQFPYCLQSVNENNAYMGLCAVYSLLNTFAAVYTLDKDNIDDLTDVCAAVFRVAEHSDFYKDAALLLRGLQNN